jgi:anti-sigma B factor antagonist
MDLAARRSGDVTVLDLSGKLTRGSGGDELLRATVDRLLEEGPGRILLNLAEVPYMDSAGIGELMAVYRKTKNGGGVTKLLNPLRRVYDVLQLVKLDSIFEVYQDEATAVASFGKCGNFDPD